MGLKTGMAALLLGALLGCGGNLTNSSLPVSDSAAPQDGGGSSTDAPDGGGTTAPSDAGASDGGTCDCSGLALPDICMVCSNGMSACAHFACVSGVCAVEICGN
jgi:hypothetical protein